MWCRASLRRCSRHVGTPRPVGSLEDSQRTTATSGAPSRAKRAAPIRASGLQHAGLVGLGVVPPLIGGLERVDEFGAGVVGFDDAVDPAAGRAVADVGLLGVGGVDRAVDGLVRRLVDGLALALAAGFLDGGEHAGSLVGAHDGALGAGPGEGEELVEGPAAHGVVARAVAAAEDDDDLGDDAVAHGVDHLGPRADDAALFAVAADHEAGGVVEEDDGTQAGGNTEKETGKYGISTANSAGAARNVHRKDTRQTRSAGSRHHGSA